MADDFRCTQLRSSNEINLKYVKYVKEQIGLQILFRVFNLTEKNTRIHAAIKLNKTAKRDCSTRWRGGEVVEEPELWQLGALPQE